MVLRGSSIGGCFASAVLGTAPLPADGKEVGRGAVPKTALANSRLYYSGSFNASLIGSPARIKF